MPRKGCRDTFSTSSLRSTYVPNPSPYIQEVYTGNTVGTVVLRSKQPEQEHLRETSQGFAATAMFFCFRIDLMFVFGRSQDKIPRL